MRVVFLGNDPWSVPPLRALAADPGTELALAITNPPRPAGRGSRLTPTAVGEAASEMGLPLMELETMAGGAASPAIRGAQADLLIVVAYGALLPPEILSIAPHGALNLHFSLLPRWRGASPVQRAILAGDAVTGASVMRMDEGLDTGPVLASVETKIADDEDAGTLGARLAELGGALLISTLDDLGAGKAVALPQDPAEATQAPKLTAAERVIDWSEGAVPIARRIRALAPAPGASTTFRGEPLKVIAARAALDHVPGMPARSPSGRTAVGAIGWTGDPGATPIVSTGLGFLALLEVAPSGRRRMPASDWARGARFAPGERLG
jgi:methionyl-tRNA formyltransferase